MKNSEVGVLYVVATPIGNLEDISFRAIKILKQVDKILAEDTRHARHLLEHYGITTPVNSFHDYNERERLEAVLQGLKDGKSIALISDAGTPLICDPGFNLVRSARQSGIKIVPIPGACAAIAALSVAGLPTDRYRFEGFIPSKLEAKRKLFENIQNESETIIFYEAPHRLMKTLQLMKEILGGERLLCVARELTKFYETVKLDTLLAMECYFNSHPDEVCGELVILLSGNGQSESSERKNYEKILDCLLRELPLKQAVALTSELTGKKKNEVYKEAIRKKS